MDNFTLLVTLTVVLFVNMVFTYIITGKEDKIALREWRGSSVFLFLGFGLILFQKRFTPIISVIMANFCILIGFFYQIAASFYIESQSKHFPKYLLPLISAFYFILFGWFTYVSYNTSARIISVSLLLTGMYAYALVLLFRNKRSFTVPILVKELFFLFSFSLFFYLFRTIATVFKSSVNSLFDPNIVTTITFSFLIIYNLTFIMGMYTAFLRYKSSLIIKEQDKQHILFSFLHQTAGQLQFSTLCLRIGDMLRDLLSVDTFGIYLTDEGKNTHSLVYVSNELQLPLDEVKTLGKGKGVSGAAIEKGRVIEVDIDSYSLEAAAAKFKEKGVIKISAVPLKSTNQIIGAIVVAFSSVHKLKMFDLPFFSNLGEQLGLVLQNAMLYEQTIARAVTDPLTGLYNRRKMMEIMDNEIERYNRTGHVFSLALLDLDYFKGVNDTFGHDCGDELLKVTSAFLKDHCREIDSISRWGGEEFLLLFPHSDLQKTLSAAERLRSRYEEKECDCLNGKTTTMSIGVVEYSQEKNIKEVISLADSALYKAKEEGRNRVNFHDPGKQEPYED